MGKNIFVTIGLVSFFTCSCVFDNDHQTTKEKHFETFEVFVNYNEHEPKKCTHYVSEDIDLKNVELRNKQTGKVIFDHIFICGEKINVYFSEIGHKHIDYAVLDDSDLGIIQLRCAPVPGSNVIDLFPKEQASTISIYSKSIKYVINSDDSYTTLENAEMYTDLFGVYHRSEIIEREYNSYHWQVIPLLALYSFPLSLDK